MERSCNVRAEPKARFPHLTEAAQCRRRQVWSSAGRLLRRFEASKIALRRSRLEEVQSILYFAQQRYEQEPEFSNAALLGCLWYVLAIFQQDAGRYEDACAHFAAARPLLQRAVCRDTAWEALLQRFLLVCLVYEQRFDDALQLGKAFLQRGRPAALLRLVGEILNQQGLRMEASPGQGRPSFARAAQLFAEAEKEVAGHPHAYSSWALSHSMLGDLAAAEKVAMQAVERCPTPFWVHPLQRPSHFLPQLYSSPWHRVEDFPWMKKLEDHWQEILAELRQLDAADADPAASAWPEVRGHDRSLAEGTGIWREFPLLGLQVDTESRCPRTWQLLTEVEAIASHWRLCPNEETALFSRLTPGTRLKPHCGPTNLHLTCHLGLEVPTGCRLRVGREWRTWQPGKCLVFDDSYEHEVQHHGDSTRIVLLVRFWHPQVPLEQREALLAQRLKQRKLKDWTLLS